MRTATKSRVTEPAHEGVSRVVAATRKGGWGFWYGFGMTHTSRNW